MARHLRVGQLDYSGDGGSDLVVEVHNGDSTTAIGQTLFDHGVVANVKTFVQAAEGNKAMTEIQPGFYKLRTGISAANAVSRLTEKNNRVGRLVIPEGRQLDDTTDVKTNKINQGIFSLISAASCVDLDGKRKCVSAEELKKAAGAADVSALLMVELGSGPVKSLGADHRRPEGLIAPGTWNVDPAGTPTSIPSGLISPSSRQYEQGGLLDAGGHDAVPDSGSWHRWCSASPTRRTSPRWPASSTTGWRPRTIAGCSSTRR